MSAFWEVDVRVTVTLTREDVADDYSPTLSEASEIDRAIGAAVASAEMGDVEGWDVDDWKVDVE